MDTPEPEKPKYIPFVLPETSIRSYGDERYVSRIPFLISDIVDDSNVAYRLRDEKIEHNRVFMGICGLRALDLMVLAGRDCGPDQSYRQAMLFDVNERQVKSMNVILQLINECETVEAFKTAFLETYLKLIEKPKYSDRAKTSQKAHMRCQENDNYYGLLGRSNLPETREGVQKYFKEADDNFDSWLQPEHYIEIRKLVTEGRIATATLDLRDKERFEAIRKDWEGKGLKLGHAYISSIMELLSPGRGTDYHSKPRADRMGDIQQVKDNIAMLADQKSRILSSVFNPHTRKAHELVSYDLREFNQLYNNETVADSKVVSRDVFGAGNESYMMLSGKPDAMFPNPYRSQLDQMGLGAFAADDASITLTVTSREGEKFTAPEMQATAEICKKMDIYSKKFEMPTPTGKRTYDIVLFRIPAERIEADPDIAHKFTEGVKAAMMKAAELESPRNHDKWQR